VCVSDVRQQHWGGRRESTGPTPGEAQQHGNVGFAGCVTAIVFEHAQEMLVCWQCGVNDDHVVVCVSNVRQQHWGRRRESTGPTPGEAQQHENVEFAQCVSAVLFEHEQEMLVCGSVASMMVVCVSDVRQQHWGRRRESTGPTPGEAQQHGNVGLGGCVTAIVFEHAHEMLVCWQCGVNDDHLAVCVCE